MTEDDQLIAVINKHLKFNLKLDKYDTPKSGVYIKVIDDMKIKTIFIDKSKILHTKKIDEAHTKVVKIGYTSQTCLFLILNM